MNRTRRLLTVLLLICLPWQLMAAVDCDQCFPSSDQQSQSGCHSVPDNGKSDPSENDISGHCLDACCFFLIDTDIKGIEAHAAIEDVRYRSMVSVIFDFSYPPLLRPPLQI